MALFKPKNPATGIERELENLRYRKSQLHSLLVAAETRLGEVLDERRRSLLEADLDKVGGERERVRALIDRHRDERDSAIDAIATIDQKLADCETRLAQERDKGARKREADKRSEEVDKARMELSEYRSANARMIDALRPLAGIVPAALAALENLQRLGHELAIGVELALAESESYVTMMRDGGAPIRTELAPPPAPPQPPKVERLTVVCLAPSKWREASGEIRSAGRLCEADPPRAIADRALQLHNAILPNSAEHLRLRETEPVDHAPQLERDCFWLDQPKPQSKPAEPHATTPVVHSGLPGARTGVAVATPLR
jgi:hypothetical protein